MDIDFSVFKQTQKSGLKQTDSRAFTAGAEGLVKLGQGLQDVGQMGVQYASAQQALYNDNLFNEAEQAFDNIRDASLIDAQFGKMNLATNKRELLDPQTLSPVTVKRLEKARKKILKGLPGIRQNKFLTNANAKIEAAKVKVFGFANTRIQSEAKGLDIQFKNNLEASAFMYKPEVLEAKKKEYFSRLARGILSGVYDSDEAVRLQATFMEDLADTLQNAKTSAMLKTDFTVEDLEQRDSEVRNDPHLDPKEKHTRADSLWRTATAIQRQRQTALESQAKKNSDEQVIKLTEKLVDDRLNPTGAAGITQEDLDEAKRLGLRDKTWINKFQEVINESKAQFQLGDEDDSPAQGYLNDLETIEFKALNNNWSDVKLSQELEIVKKKARAEFKNDQLKKTTFKELGQINSQANDVLTRFRDEGKRNLQQAKQDATKSLTRRLGGGDKAFDKFNSRRNEIVEDAIEAAHLLIERGMDDDKAVDKVLRLVTNDEDEGVQAFDAEQFGAVLKRASSGKLTQDDRDQLGEMIIRARKASPVIKPPPINNK